MNFLLQAFRRNPYPTYSAMRTIAPVFHDRWHGFWAIFDYENVKRRLLIRTCSARVMLSE